MGAAALSVFDEVTRLPYWEQEMEIDIESWMTYGVDFRPVSVNALFSEALGQLAEMALCAGSEFLYMESQGGFPVGTLVPENLIRPHACSVYSSSFAMVFAYSQRMERVFYNLANEQDGFGAGITVCGIWKNEILVDECKVIVAASENPLFDVERFLTLLKRELDAGDRPEGLNVPYFAEKLGYRRACIPYETDDVTHMGISQLLMGFEFEETRRFVGPVPELSLDDF